MEGVDQYAIARRRLIELLRARGIADEKVLAAMNAVPRERFVPPGVIHRAYHDNALPIGRDATISQPHIVAIMTEALALTGDERVLEVGTGSGYQAAVLAEITPHVCSIERDQVLYHRAKEALQSLGYRSIALRWGDGMQGWAESGPFDAIMVTAAGPSVPRALIDQLADGGRLVMPKGGPDVQTLVVVEKEGERAFERRLCDCVFIPLVSGTVG